MDVDSTFQSDAIFQLEMNLHNVRKELILMLEIYEETSCLSCYQLKCQCTKESDDNKSESSKSESKIDLSTDMEPGENIVAPPASSLPIPNFDIPKENSPGTSTSENKIDQDVEAWLDAAIKSNNDDDDDDKQVTIVKEASLLSPNDNLLLIDKQKKTPHVAFDYVNNENAVEAFFKYFKMPSDTAVTYVSAKLAVGCTKPVKEKYTYF